MTAYIYKIHCKINDRVYVGQTRQVFPKRRYEDHCCRLRKNKHRNKYLQLDWNRYGEENFVFEIIEQFNADFNFSLDNLEQYWIKELESNNPEKGYNKTDGGTVKFKMNEESIELLSMVKTRQTGLFKDTSQWKQDNPRQDVRQIKKSISKKGNKNPMFGNPAPNRKRVRCKETGEEFESLHECGKKMGILVQNLVHHLKGRYRRTGGHTFEYV